MELSNIGLESPIALKTKYMPIHTTINEATVIKACFKVRLRVLLCDLPSLRFHTKKVIICMGNDKIRASAKDQIGRASCRERV